MTPSHCHWSVCESTNVELGSELSRLVSTEVSAYQLFLAITPGVAVSVSFCIRHAEGPGETA